MVAVFLRGRWDWCRRRLNRRIFRRTVESRNGRASKGRDRFVVGHSKGARGRQRRRWEIFREPRRAGRRHRRRNLLRRRRRRSGSDFHDRHGRPRNHGQFERRRSARARCCGRSNNRGRASRHRQPDRFGHGTRTRCRHGRAIRTRDSCWKHRRTTVVPGVHLTISTPFFTMCVHARAL